MNKTNSVIDYVKEDLDPKIWDLDGELSLQPAVRAQIEDIVYSAIDDLDLPETAVKDIFIYGSILTNQWNKNTDIDARIVLDPESVKERYKDITGDDLFDLVQMQVHDIEIKGTKHPFNATIVIDGEDTELGKSQLGKTKDDPVYDVLNDKVIVPPSLEDDSFDPDVEFSEEREEAEKVMETLDIILRETRNDLIDYDTLKEAVGDVKNPKIILEKIENKINEIEENIEQLVEEYKNIKTDRTTSLNRPTENSRHKAPKNVSFKMLEKYQYIKILREVKRLLKDGLKEEELPELEKVVSIAKRIGL